MRSQLLLFLAHQLAWKSLALHLLTMNQTTVISVEHLSKACRLGQTGTGTLSHDLNVWWAKVRGKPNPLLKIGQQDHGNREGETNWAPKDVSFDVRHGEVLGIIGRGVLRADSAVLRPWELRMPLGDACTRMFEASVRSGGLKVTFMSFLARPRIPGSQHLAFAFNSVLGRNDRSEGGH